ncbi:MAG: Modulator of FtsH protease HflK [Pseudomonadota bacterium]|jgi:membrane protease subunit HflK
MAYNPYRLTSMGGMIGRIALAMTGKRSPWGKDGSSGDGGDDGSTEGAPEGADGNNAGPPAAGEPPKGPRNPWLPGGGTGGANDAPGERPRRSASIEDIFRNRGPEGPRRGGGGDGPRGPGGPNFRLPQRADGKSWLPVAIGVAALLWIGVSSVHQVGPKEQALVTWFGGKYQSTLQPGLSMTFPWPINHVDVEPVSEFRSEAIPGGEAQNLMLTGDQNLVDLSYTVRWNIKDLKLFRFQLDKPEDTVREVAEAAMRASVAERGLNDVLSGAGRGDIEQRVMQRMQSLLNTYRSGIQVQGVQISKTDPPTEVEDAFKNVSAAQQTAESYINQAQAAAQQVLARAQGDAAAFDKVYAQYRLAPDVTRRRMYYETMERVLRQTDKTVIEAPGVAPYLPLPEVRRSAPTPPVATQGNAQ